LHYAAIVCAYHQLDLLDAAMCESEMTSFSAAIPFTLATGMHGSHFRMACVWHAKGEGLCLGTLYNRRITSVLELKRCFLLRHEAVNIAIRFGDMVKDFTCARGPRQDVWWRKFCICGEKDSGERYVQCKMCLNWFHPRCVNLDKVPRGTTPWFCPDHQPAKIKMQAAAEPREDQGGPRDGGDGKAATVSSSSLHLEPVRQLFKVRLLACLQTGSTHHHHHHHHCQR